MFGVGTGTLSKTVRSFINQRSTATFSAWNRRILTKTKSSQSTFHSARLKHSGSGHSNVVDKPRLWDYQDLAGRLMVFAVAGGLAVKLWIRKSACKEQQKQKKARENARVLGEKFTLSRAIENARDVVLRIKDETGSPGLVIGVSIDGQEVWSEGFGYADVENRVLCTPDTVLRIASISKSITMTTVAKLWEAGLLDLDKPVQYYVPKFPEKEVEGEKVIITTRHLLSHLGGIRHYDKSYIKKGSKEEKKKKKKKEKDKNNDEEDEENKCKKEKKDKDKRNEDENDEGKKDKKKKKDKIDEDKEKYKKDKKNKDEKDKEKKEKKKKKDENKDDEDDDKKDKKKKKKEKKEKKKKKKDEMENKEYYLTHFCKSVSEGMKLFEDDPLVHKPGSAFLYTTYGWTLVSAVLEGATQKSFTDLMLVLFKDLGLENTYLDENEPLIYRRARNYVKNENGRLINSPYVDNSYKWAGGGFLSTVGDLIKFGNAMLFSYQYTPIPELNDGSCDQRTEVKSPKDVETMKVENFKRVDGELTPENLPGYLKSDTLKAIWTPVENTSCSWDKDGSYGMGWAVIPEKIMHGHCRQQRYYVSHTGGAVGASSVLLVLPRSESDSDIISDPPQGVVVAVIVNMVSVGLNKMALTIAKMFERVDDISGE